MKKTIVAFVVVMMLAFICTTSVRGESVYEFEGGTALGEGENALSDLLDSLPQNTKEELLSNGSGEITDYDAQYFLDKLLSSLEGSIAPFVSTAATLIGVVILSAIFYSLADSMGTSTKSVMSLCSSLCVALITYTSLKSIFLVVEEMLTIMSDTMLLMIPAMEAVYISAGNITSAAVTATGVQLIIGFTQSVLAKMISPAVFVSFILAVTSSVTKNSGVCYMSKTLRGLITGALVIIMSIFTIVLSIQVIGAQAQDTLTAKTVRFALGSYVPIVGSSVAESFSVMTAGLSVIKQGCGITGIVLIIIAFLPPFAALIMGRLALGISGAVAGMLGCDREASFLDECKGITSLLIAVSSGAAVTYIIALGIFCKTSLAGG